MRKSRAPLVASAIAVFTAAASTPAFVASQNVQPSPAAQRSTAALRDSLKAALGFLASFDRGFDADYAHGDPAHLHRPIVQQTGFSLRRRHGALTS